MQNQIVNLTMPAPLFGRIQQRAAQANRSVEDEAVRILASSVPDEKLSSEYEDLLASLCHLDNDELRRAAQSSMAADLAQELENLHLKRQREGLSESDSQRTAELIRVYERCMLVRAKAGALMIERTSNVGVPQ
jgi:plasmid stability protein